MLRNFFLGDPEKANKVHLQDPLLYATAMTPSRLGRLPMHICIIHHSTFFSWSNIEASSEVSPKAARSAFLFFIPGQGKDLVTACRLFASHSVPRKDQPPGSPRSSPDSDTPTVRGGSQKSKHGRTAVCEDLSHNG